MNCGILKSKLILCEWNAFYFIEIAVIGFTLDEIKQCIVFFGTPGMFGKHCDVVHSCQILLVHQRHCYKIQNERKTEISQESLEARP